MAACWSCKGHHERRDWVGLTETQIRAKLGNPTWVASVPLSRRARLLQHQSALYKHLPATDGEVVEVREMQWESFCETTAVWLIRSPRGEWVVIETLVWLAYIKF